MEYMLTAGEYYEISIYTILGIIIGMLHVLSPMEKINRYMLDNPDEISLDSYPDFYEAYENFDTVKIG